MMTRIVVDPVTRIEGHLRIEATLDRGVITDAISSGTMWRGLEVILKGRDPREAWAFTERILRRWRLGNWATLGALGLLATSTFFWGLSLVAEVYTLHTALMAALILALFQWSDSPTPKRMAIVGLLAGMGMSHHAAIVLLVVGGAIPRNFIPAVEKGVNEAIQDGVLIGSPVTDIRVSVYDGSYHPVDSSEICFKIAGAGAVKKGLARGNPSSLSR
jgi:hypothetical protein